MCSKVLVLYGFSDWENLTDTRISNYLNGVKVIQIWELPHLKYYLENDDMHLEKIILPLQIYKQQELNWNNIQNVYGNSNEIIDIFDNKKLFVDYIQKIELEHLIPYVYKTYKDEYKLSDKIVIVKEYINCFGQGITIQPLRELNQSVLDNFVVQEYIYSSIEYAAQLVVKNGTIIHYKIYKKSINVENNKEYILDKNSNYNKFESVEIGQTYMWELEQIVKHCDYTGFCCIDFKIVDDKLYVFENNCRLGGSLIANIDDLGGFIRAVINN